MVEKYTMNILQPYGCEGEGCGAFVDPEVDVDGCWIRDIDYTPLESSHAELLGALNAAWDCLLVYEASGEKLEHIRIVLRQALDKAIKRATEEKQ